MKSRSFIFTGIAMFLLIATSKAEVSISFDGNDLIANSDQKGVEGFKGCYATNLEKIPAYTFRLLKNDKPANNAACKIPSGKWKEVDEQTSNNGSVLFRNLGDGEYKVVCLVGKAIGCLIDEVPDGYPLQSIVFEKEISAPSFNGNAKKRLADTNSLASIEGSLLVFPNPAQHEINIQLNNPKMQSQVHMIIYDLLGKQLYAKNYTLNNEGSDNWQVRTEDYPSGTYLLRIYDADGVSMERKFQIVQSK